MSFHDKTAKEVLAELQTTESGLLSSEATRRMGIYGRNVLAETGRIHPLRILLSQFTSPIVWVLLAAMVISLVVEEYTDFGVIAVIVVLNAILGFVQEYRAETAIAALQKLTALKAKALREGREQLIDASELVPGDIILLETGDKVPADGRLIEVVNLQTQEAALTGESTPVHKQPKPVAQPAQVADRTCMVFSGTIVTAGRAKAVVTGTANKTELGRIATLIQEAEREQTPLQKKLSQLSVWLTLLVVAIAIIVFVAGALQGQPLFQFFLAAIALAVAAIPEGLPAIVTISLAFGVQRMASRNALIRKLPSAETLGACTVICADKTGTLTANEMTVRKAFVDGKVVAVTGSGYTPEGEFSIHPKDLDLLLTIGAMNNNSKLTREGDSWRVFGDPTEAALLVSAAKTGIETGKRIGEIEFTSERKRMTTFHKVGKRVVAYVKGAPDVVLEHCSRIIMDGKVQKLTPKERKTVLDVNKRFGAEALRVLGFAYTYADSDRSEKVEKDLIFVGLQAMIDPPRPDVKRAIAECATAGIKVIMITGDHPETAQAIAKELGITGKTLTGAELDAIPDLAPHVEDIGVYARVNPEHKIRIIEALQKKGHIAAMTGDGVNDAPALKKANIGIAMGLSGTDVAKEASVMVLADDNFASIVSAVKEGRRIYDNIGQFIEYLLSSNLGEVLTVFSSIALRLTLPVSAIMLLWINLVTDGLPALALGVEPAEKDVMQRPPRKPTARILDRARAIEMVLLAVTMMVGTLGIFVAFSDGKAQTMAFVTLVLMQLFNVLNQRSEHRSVFTMNPFSNPWLLLAILSSLLLQILVVHTSLNSVFGTTPLTLTEWGIAMLVASSVLWLGELIKLVRRLSTPR